jgi:hypothetical protein
MPAMTIVNNPFVTVWYHPESKIVHSKVHKFITGREFREFLMAGKDALVRNKAQKWLSDDRGSTVLKQEDVDWGHQNWFPECVKHGWKYWAIVQPEKVLAQTKMEELVKKFAAHGVTSKFFTNDRDALTWLERQP